MGLDRNSGDGLPRKTSPIQPPAKEHLIVSCVNVIRNGYEVPFLDGEHTVSSSSVRWDGITLENYAVPPVLISRHQHPEHFLHMVLRGTVNCEVRTGGRDRQFRAHPGSIFLLPRGTIDETRWLGSTERMAASIHPSLLTRALEETSHEVDIELTEHWDLVDRHISALLLELQADLKEGSPAGTMYGESLAVALAVYLLNRYAAQRLLPATCKGGLPGYRLKRVLDYIEENIESDISLYQLSTIANMSPHYFSELFKHSMRASPHQYVLSRKIERAKQQLSNPKLSVIDVGLSVGFRNPSHFARVFRKIVTVSPSAFRSISIP